MAALLEIRQRFIEQTGRYDLVSDLAPNYTDNGANYFIEEGRKFLDILAPGFGLEELTLELTFSASEYIKNISNSRSILRVRLSDADEGENYLNKYTLSALRRKWGIDAQLANVDEGVPIDYAIGNLRDGSTIDTTTEAVRALFVMPPADDTYTVYVEGIFFSAILTNDTDVNYWSIAWPSLLIEAARYKLEESIRNSAGMQDHLNTLNLHLGKIDDDVVYQENVDINHLADSWEGIEDDWW